MSLIQTFSKSIINNIKIIEKNIYSKKNLIYSLMKNSIINFYESSDKLIIIDNKNMLKLNNIFLFCKIEENNIILNANFYIKGKPFNFEDFFLIKNIKEKINLESISFKDLNSLISNKNNNNNNFKLINDLIQNNKLVKEILNDLNFNFNLKIEQIVNIKKFNFISKNENIFELCNTNIYYINIENYSVNENYRCENILRLITQNPQSDYENWIRFKSFLEKNLMNNNIFEQENYINPYFFYF